MDEKSIISKAMAILGSRTSAKKTKACRKNAQKPRPNGRKNRKKRTKMKSIAAVVCCWFISAGILIWIGETHPQGSSRKLPGGIEIIP